MQRCWSYEAADRITVDALRGGSTLLVDLGHGDLITTAARSGSNDRAVDDHVVASSPPPLDGASTR